MPSLLLGVRMTLFDFKRIKMDDVNFESKIETFKSDVSKKASIPKESLELVYCGNILEDESTLSKCGVKPGVMVHVLKKKTKTMPIPSHPMTENEIQALVVAFRALNLSPTYRNSLQKLSRPNALENIIMITPGLNQDPVAISIIQDPELLIRLGDTETVRRIVEFHPALAEAANNIAAAVHAEAVSNSSNPTGASTSTGFVNILESISDDDMESSQSSDSTSRVASAPGFITTAQLAAALASASQAAGAGAGGTGETNSAEGNSAITSEMVSEAMLRAWATVAPDGVPLNNTTSTATPASNNGVSSSTPAPAEPNYEDQLRQMRELGLMDDALNRQALQIAAGNVHAAVDLVFSGAIFPNDQ